jgi:NADP-dependent 3-hydroxy acid dehydrogenase YdfG
MSEEETQQKVVLITGCSSGIGLETAIECCKNNMYVFACVRNPNKAFELKKRMEDENLTEIKIIEMDVSNDISIKNGISQILNLTDRIDVLFNNAGRMILGSLEDLTDSELIGQINTDLRGVIILTKNIIPIMRKNKSGLIINMSSVAGRIGFPLSTAYCISKFGIEGLSQALRRELMLRNINVCLIEAGVVNTKFFSNMSDAVMSKDSAYADETKIMRDSINKIQKEKFSQASDVSKEVLKIINDGGKEFRYIVGNDAEAMIAALESSQDDQIKMDTAIYNIMKEWEN